MNQQRLIEALAIIAEEQQQSDAMVEIRIGGRKNEQKGELYLLDCSSAVIDALIDQGFSIEASRFSGTHVTYQASDF